MTRASDGLADALWGRFILRRDGDLRDELRTLAREAEAMGAKTALEEKTIQDAPHDSSSCHSRSTDGNGGWVVDYSKCDCWKADYDAAKEAL